jgi:hypothetical protein
MSTVRSVALVNLLLSILLAPFSATAQEKSHVTSEQVNKAVQELEQLAQKKIQENAVPGLAIAVVFQDKARYAKGFGVRDVNTKAPVDADTVFQLASVSKPIGSTVVAALVGEPLKNKSEKFQSQAPSSREVSPSNPKHAAISVNYWSLRFLWSLELGCWSFPCARQ